MDTSKAKFQHCGLPYSQWPDADKAAWEAANQAADIFDEAGKAAGWRPKSRASAQRAYGRLLAWLSSQEVNLEAEQPAVRLTRDRMQGYAAFLQATCSSVSVASYFGVLCMCVIAMFPMHDWGWLRLAQRQLRRAASPTRAKAEYLVPLFDLLKLGMDLMEESEEGIDAIPADAAGERARLKAARTYRNGLMIALLACRPVRVGNLLQTQIGKHLQISDRMVTVQYTKHETKHKRALAFVWPQDLRPALDRYLQVVRPMLMNANVPGSRAPTPKPAAFALWIAQGGAALTPAGLHKAISRHTSARFGYPIVAQRFRDCVATTVVNDDPSLVNDAANLLGHTNKRTTERHYIAANTLAAFAEYHKGTSKNSLFFGVSQQFFRALLGAMPPRDAIFGPLTRLTS